MQVGTRRGEATTNVTSPMLSRTRIALTVKHDVGGLMGAGTCRVREMQHISEIKN